MEKNKLLTFIFSFIPGAGYMYLNMMAKGTIFMLGAAALAITSMWFEFNALIVFMPVIWCYTFFDTFHVGRMDYETRLNTDREFIASVKNSDFRALLEFVGKKRRLMGFLAIFIAIYLVIYSVFYPIFRYYFDSEFFYILIDMMPSIIVIVLLFILGSHLIKKDKSEDFLPYKGSAEHKAAEDEKE